MFGMASGAVITVLGLVLGVVYSPITLAPKVRKFYRVFVFRCVRQVSRLMTWGLSGEVSGE